MTDGDKHATEYAYDSAGNRTSMVDPEKDETKWTYDSTHDVETETIPKGETTTIERDSHGNPIKVSRPAPESRTQVTKYKYGAHGELESVTNPDRNSNGWAKEKQAATTDNGMTKKPANTCGRISGQARTVRITTTGGGWDQVSYLPRRSRRTEVAMNDPVIPTEIDQAVALHWLRFSLDQGEVEVIAPAALTFLAEQQGHAYTLAPETVDLARLIVPREGGVTGTRAAQEGLAVVLERLAERGAACVVVEDELTVRRGPKSNWDGLLKTAFVGERVIHWAGFESGAQEGRLVVDCGSGDYPTNAFITSASAEELGLVDGADVDSYVAARVVGSLMAVIVAAYDAETFIIWEPS